MSKLKFVAAGACLLAIAAASPGIAESVNGQSRTINAPRTTAQPVVQPLKPRTQQRATPRAVVKAPEASPKRFIFTLSDRLVGAKAEITSDVEAIRAERDRNLAAQEQAGAAFRRAGLTEIKAIKGSRFMVAAATSEQIAALRQQGLIQSVQQERMLSPTIDESVPLINPPAIWNVFNRGKGQVVAIIDTGIRSTHDMLSGRLESEACFSTTSTSLGTTATCAGGSTAPGSGAPCTVTKCGHGTHVAGIAVGRAGGSATMNGVAPDARYISIQAYSEYQGRAEMLEGDMMDALNHIIDLKLSGKRIVSVNISGGGGQYSGPCYGPVEPVFQQLRALGVTPVVSSGNEGYQGEVSYPACSPSAFTVASSTKQNTMASHSNLSVMVDVLAPGTDITSAYFNGNNSYATGGGTSMAAPHVAGAFALLRQVYSCYTSETLENALRNNGVPIQGPGSTGTFPRIDLGATYAALGQFRVRNCPMVKATKSPAINKKLQAKPL